MTVALLPAGFVGSCCWNGRSIPQAEWEVEWSGGTGAIAIVCRSIGGPWAYHFVVT